MKIFKKPSVHKGTLKEFRSRVFIHEKEDKRDFDYDAVHASDGPELRRRNARLEASIDFVMKKFLRGQIYQTPAEAKLDNQYLDRNSRKQALTLP